MRDTATGGITPRTCKGALGTWRVLVGVFEHSVGNRSHKREPMPTGKPPLRGVYMCHHLSLLISGKAVGGSIPRSERYSGNPTVADRRGACRNVMIGSDRHLPRSWKQRTQRKLLTYLMRALHFYPDRGNNRSSKVECVRVDSDVPLRITRSKTHLVNSHLIHLASNHRLS